MTLTPWTHENAFLPGTIVRADAMNLKLDGIAQAIQAICNQINQKIPNLPATFTGETQIPEKTLPNTLLFINSAGAMDLYPKAQFDTDVAAAANSAAQAATSANNAAFSAEQAETYKNSSQSFAASAEDAAESAQLSATAANQAKNDTMSELNTRLGTSGNLGNAATANILGTVSQSSGIPTGAIIENGSNANGTYTKYADGTLICEVRTTYNNASGTTWTFPAVFYNIPSVVTGHAGGATNSLLVAMNAPTNTSVVYTVIVSTTAAAFTSNSRVDFIAKGRWF